MSDVTLPSMNGIPAELTARISDEWQAQLAKAIPECRIVWNNHAEQFQVVYEEPKHAQQIDGTHLRGWVIIATFEPDSTMDSIIALLRKREEFVAWKLQKMGYQGDTLADRLEAYLDDDSALERMSEQLHDDACDEYFGGPLGRTRDEDAVWEKRTKRAADQTRRHSAHTKLVVPVQRAGITRELIIP